MRVRSRFGLTLTLTFAALAACSLTTSLDDLTGGVPDAGSDGSVPVDGGEGGAGEGGAGDEGGLAGDADAGGGWIPCALRTAGAVLFCDDFDDPLETAGAKWNYNPIASDSGALATTTSDALSPPRAFAASVTATGEDEDAFLAEKPTLIDPQTATTLRLSFATKLDPSSFTSADGSRAFDFMQLAGLQFDDAACPTVSGQTSKERWVHLSVQPDRSIVMSLRGLATDCVDGGTDFAVVTTGISVPQLGDWHAVMLKVSRNVACTSGAVAAAKSELLVDGVPHGCADLGIDPFLKLSKFHFFVGMSGGSIGTNGSATFDNVEVDLR